MNQKKIIKLERVWQYVQKDYEILDVIGQGSFGLVALAEHKQTQKKYAIKLIKNIFDSLYDAKKIIREVQLMLKLSKIKDNIFTVKLHDIIIPPTTKLDGTVTMEFDKLFLVQEYYGYDMRQILIKSGRDEFTEEHITIMIYNMLCCMNFMHSANIVHRDIKPANILINDQCNVKICDFGLARSIFSEPKQSDIRQVKNKIFDNKMSPIIGSRFYRSPETILMQSTQNFAMDIWATGCILAELLLDIYPQKIDPECNEQKKFLFDGDSCYPISPVQVNNQAIKGITIKLSKNDQLIKILEIIGKPDIKTLKFINEQDVKTYVSTVSDNIQIEKSLDERFPYASTDLKELLKELLVFNPNNRKSAEELLELDVFKQIRNKNIEKLSKKVKKINLEIDQFEINIDNCQEEYKTQFQEIIIQQAKKIRMRNIKSPRQ